VGLDGRVKPGHYVPGDGPEALASPQRHINS
jgi:hypothetical protein